MELSWVWGYYLIYVFFAFLFYVFIKRKVYLAGKPAGLFYGAIALGMIAPFIVFLFGFVIGFLVLTAGALILSFFFQIYKEKEQHDSLIEESVSEHHSVKETDETPLMVESIFQDEDRAEDRAKEKGGENDLATVEKKEEREMNNMRNMEETGKEEAHSFQVANEDNPLYHFAENETEMADSEPTGLEDARPDASREEELYYSVLREAAEEESEQQQQNDFLLELPLEETNKEETASDALEVSERNEEHDGEEGDCQLADDVLAVFSAEHVEQKAQEMEEVERHFLAAHTELAEGKHENALQSLKKALAYKIPFAARLMIMEDYIKVLHEMGLYGQSIQELQSLLLELEKAELEEEQRSKYEADIMQQIHYFETKLRSLETEENKYQF
ncbi:hypothetical protein ACH33_04095 [Aneurinibacillus sp. XH2]|uniref:Yip1 family protein n=1 Tax=Aneurinibacillus sp. XH2 TaxID=1450761 RepID=UPI0007098B27|nr:Yip1 family protein [Aneurinibacillus sp. XH2]AMA72110.1 hypothetical protein ACH33_04095 [Aneurinibacillus sp. XH2]